MSQIRRVPHCSHWGAYTLLVEDDQIIGIEPFPQDPAPSPIIHSVTEWTRPERRILTPMVREGWLQSRDLESRKKRGEDRFVPISWKEATTLVADEIRRVSRERGNEAIFAGSYGWASCGRFHHAPTMLKRMLNLVGGFTGHVDTYSYAAGPVILRHVLGSADLVTGRAQHSGHRCRARGDPGGVRVAEPTHCADRSRGTGPAHLRTESAPHPGARRAHHPCVAVAG